MSSGKFALVAAAGYVFAMLSCGTISAQETATQNNLRMFHDRTGAPVAILKTANEDLADAVKRQFAPYFGIRQPADELTVKRIQSSTDHRQHIRYQQLHAGIPVLGGELLANLKNELLTSMSGEVARVTLGDLQPAVLPDEAGNIAKQAVAKWYQLDSRDLQTTDPELMIYDPKLIGPATTPQALVWKLVVTSAQIFSINELVLIDAHTGVITLHFSQIDTALRRITYSANNTTSLPGTLVCDESDPDCATGDSDARYAHRFAADTYNFYFNTHGRDSIDDKGMTIISTTHYGSAQPNAYWNGSQIVYSDGFSVADDVVAHELTHGVTDSTSGLLYYYQSGAINESFSDVWGEFVDLTNNSGTDTNSVRWELGEDVPGIGTVRDMQNPPSLGDPDRMTSPNYAFDPDFLDNGGVHTNSGINNKAVTLMVDGGNFNGRTVSGIGITKVAKIYYAVQTNYLTSGSDYLDLYYALNEACQNLVGTDNITDSDCATVKNATEAVEMNQPPTSTYSPEAILCTAGQVPNNFFQDNFETGLANWTTQHLLGTNSWSRITGYATSGQYAVHDPGSDTAHDTALRWNSSISLPATGTYYIHFKHAFDFEAGATNNYDGGVIEYSIDGGNSWLDAGGLIDSGRQYNGSIYSSGDNPLAGRQAFTAASHGYNSTRLNLASLAGNNLRFRFRSGADTGASSLFWIIDDFRLYSCIANTAPNADAGPDRNVNANTAVMLNGSASTDPDGDTLTYQWTQTAGASVTLTGANTPTPSFTSPMTMSTLVFRLQVTDSKGQPDTDTIVVVVNGVPTADAGSDQTVNLNDPVTLNGSGVDPEGSTVTYQWTQTGGTDVTMRGSTTPTMSFTAPLTPTTLTFLFAVTDDRDQTTTDSVTVTVRDPAASNGSGGGCAMNPGGRFDPIWLAMLLIFSLFHLHRRIHPYA